MNFDAASLEALLDNKASIYICPGICEIMCLTRFEQVYRFLHLCDSDKEVVAWQPGYDYLFIVRNLLDLLSPRFLSQYHTHEELSVDDAMILSRVGLA